MLYPDFSPEERDFNEVVQQFLRKECTSQTVRRNHGAAGPDTAVWKGLAELGLFATCVPEVLGGLAGSGGGLRQTVLPLEATAAALVPGPVAETLAFADTLAASGSRALQERLLPRIASGDMMASLALLDEPHRYEPNEVAVIATRRGDGWRLSGRKLLVLEAESCGALLVSAREQGGGPVRLFVVEAAAPGLSLRRHSTIDPGARHAAVELRDTPAEPLEAMDGAHARLHALAAWMSAAQLVGVASRALDMAVAYAGERKQFGQPIGAFQAIKHMCADMHVGREMSRAACHHAGWELAEGAPGAALAASVAKACAADACRAILYDALQVHGGIGFTWEHDLHLCIKRGKSLEHAFGNATWHREAIAQAAILREPVTEGAS